MSSPPVAPEQSPREKSKFAKKIASRLGLGKSKRSREGISSPRETSEDVEEYQTSPTSSSANRAPDAGPLYVSSEAARSKTNYSPMQQSIQHNDSLRKSQGAFGVSGDTANVDPWAPSEAATPPPQRSTGSSASRMTAVAPASENAPGLNNTALSDTATSGLKSAAKPTEPSLPALSSKSVPETAPVSGSSASSALTAAGAGGSKSSAAGAETISKPIGTDGPQSQTLGGIEHGGLKEPRPSSQLPDASRPSEGSNLGPAVAAGLQGLPSRPSGESGGSTGSTVGPDLGPKHTHDIGPKHTHEGPLGAAASDSPSTQDTSPVAVPAMSSDPAPSQASSQTFGQASERSGQQKQTASQAVDTGSASSQGRGSSSGVQGSAEDFKQALAPIAGSTQATSEQPTLTQDPVGYTQSVAPSAGQKLKELQAQYAPAALGGKASEGGSASGRPADSVSPPAATNGTASGTTAASQQPSLNQNPVEYVQSTAASAGQKLQDLQAQYAPAALGGKAQDGAGGVKGSIGSTSQNEPAGEFSAPSDKAATSQQPSLTQNIVGYTQSAAASAGQTLKGLQEQYAPSTAAKSGEPTLAQDPVGYSQGVAATAGQKLKELQDQYAPVALGGRIEEKDDVRGLDPARGMPADAPVKDAAVGGPAASIAGLAAAAASGDKSALSAKGASDDIKGYEPAQGVPENAPVEQAAVGGAAASIAPLAAAAAAGDTKALAAKEDTLAAKPTEESLNYATTQAGGTPGGDGKVETGFKPQQGLPKDAPASQAAVGGAAGSIAPLAAAAASGGSHPNGQGKASASGPANAAAYATNQAGSASEGGADNITGANPPRGLPRDASAGDAAIGGDAGRLAPLAAAAATGGSQAAADKEGSVGSNPDASTAAAYASSRAAGLANGSDNASRSSRQDTDSVRGLQPQQGVPQDAPVSQAATGGTAASIAPIAAAVASGHSEESAQDAAKPAVNEPMAYSKLKAVTAGNAPDSVNSAAKTAPSGSSAFKGGAAESSKEGGLSPDGIEASTEGAPGGSSGIGKDTYDRTSSLKKGGVGDQFAAGPSSAADGVSDDDEDDVEPEIQEMPSMDPNAYPANFVDNRPPPTDRQRLGRQASRMKTAEQRRRLGLDRQDPGRHDASEINVIAWTFGALVILSGFKVPLPTWAWAIALGLALFYTINRSKRNRARA